MKKKIAIISLGYLWFPYESDPSRFYQIAETFTSCGYENLCEFLSQVMIRGEGGIFWAQNAEYTRTSEMVRMIAEVSGHKIMVRKFWNWGVKLAAALPGKTRRLANKAFGNFSYDQSMSKYDFDYQIVGLRESIERTER